MLKVQKSESQRRMSPFARLVGLATTGFGCLQAGIDTVKPATIVHQISRTTAAAIGYCLSGPLKGIKF